MTHLAAGRKLIVSNGREQRTDGQWKHLGVIDSGSFRATFYDNPRGGKGTELLFYAPGNIGTLQAYDRDTSHYLDLSINSKNISLNPQEGGKVTLPAGTAHSPAGLNNYTEFTWVVPGAANWYETPIQVTYTATGVNTRYEWQTLLNSPTVTDFVVSFGFDGAITIFHCGRTSLAIAGGNTLLSGVVYGTPTAGVHRASLFLYSSTAGGGLTGVGKSGLFVTEQRS